ncbi:PqqD family peptide modification chaperone [Pseudobutyrivibrio xylanivorans]|uniref:PqqD family protein n=1 Tax=Pseudobutyrivibrio xylanivorans TaxID=185007 RepID=A0A5P6VW68_PSEXY|nr:PqqD family peptide modification chaperone [Pseudobutyrivibrio xylanivorans]QFJ56051.1 PqqD family protein [Pseudobutyrivibrio xylanivorans]
MDLMNKKIKIEKKLDVTELDGEKVMIDFDSGKYFMIKGSGNDIWDMMEDNMDISTIVENLLKEYDVDREVCQESVISFVNQMKDYGFVSLV